MAVKKPLTQTQVIEKLSVSQGMTKVQVKAFFSGLVDLAATEAKVGFNLPGFGKLTLAKRKARKGRNPATGESIKIPAKTVVKFRLSKSMKDAVLEGGAKKKSAEKKATPKKKAAKKAVKTSVKKVAKK